jgi:hypothetical protein
MAGQLRRHDLSGPHPAAERALQGALEGGFDTEEVAVELRDRSRSLERRTSLRVYAVDERYGPL